MMRTPAVKIYNCEHSAQYKILEIYVVFFLLGQEVASYWYSTVRRYNYFKDNGLLHTNVNAGHFTQMVWVKTKYFGIGKATSKTGKIFVVAYYYPAGKLIKWNVPTVWW